MAALVNAYMTASLAPTALIGSTCIHCGKALPEETQDSRFCCRGCEAVYSILSDRGWLGFYDLQRAEGAPSAAPAGALGEDADSAHELERLSDPEFVKAYARGNSMRFFLHGMHCAACVWLLERLPEVVPGLESFRVNFAESVATTVVTRPQAFAAVAREAQRLGYRPFPIAGDENEELQRKEARWQLARLAVAAVISGNLMLLSAARYAGLPPGTPIAEVFRWAELLLFVPIVTFSAYPFYRAALSAIRSRRVSMDVPVVFGTVLGSLASLANFARGSEATYFDSISMLIFLLLATRIVFAQSLRKAAASARIARFLTPLRARVVLESGGPEERVVELPVERIQAGQVIEVRAGECVPVDGEVIEGESRMNWALLTGESRPVLAESGSQVIAGIQNLEAPLRIRVRASGTRTRLSQILQAVERDAETRSPITGFTDQVGRVFAPLSLGLVVLAFVVGLRQSFDTAIQYAIALSIVTCPCTFALATPLAMSLGVARCARRGILVRGADALERFSRVREVFFDKTGTLTAGTPVVTTWTVSPGMDLSAVQRAVYALEEKSSHPVARAICASLYGKVGSPPRVSEFGERLGFGVRGKVDGGVYEVRRLGSQGSNGVRAPRSASGEMIVGAYRGSELAALIFLKDQLKPESLEVLETIRGLGLPVSILSGDSEEAVRSVAGELSVSDVIGAATPEEKRRILLEHPRALMVGDGANDAAALSAAYASVAVSGGVEASLRAASACLLQPDLRRVPLLLVVSRETLRVVHRNLDFSLIYNLAAAVATLTGHVTPLFAAVLMPMSALTVLLSTFAGTRTLRRALKGAQG